mmetsp:Transcript_12172/g.18363  ORF Transcript_12172/g.18363 Transcript_12172/m.18363 type:complete len:111 (-) Transcript_12172:580-912(-)
MMMMNIIFERVQTCSLYDRLIRLLQMILHCTIHECKNIGVPEDTCVRRYLRLFDLDVASAATCTTIFSQVSGRCRLRIYFVCNAILVNDYLKMSVCLTYAVTAVLKKHIF